MPQDQSFANEDEEARYWLTLLRDGSKSQKGVARKRLAGVFQQRNMLDEAIELLELNERDGLSDSESVAWLRSLRGAQGGRADLNSTVLGEQPAPLDDGAARTNSVPDVMNLATSPEEHPSRRLRLRRPPDTDYDDEFQIADEKSDIEETSAGLLPTKPGRFRRIAEALPAIGDGLGMWAQIIIFPLVFFGWVQATGAPPGGFLSGRIGEIFAFVSHALAGTMMGAINALSWPVSLLVLFGLIGTLRLRARWYSVPVGLAAWGGLAVLYFLIEAVGNWLGSVNMVADGAIYWATSMGVWISLMGRLPLWTMDIWRWTNVRGRRGLYESEFDLKPMTYWQRVRLFHQVLTESMGKGAVATVQGVFVLGTLLVGWEMNRWAGLAIAFVAAATFWRLAEAVVLLVAGVLVAVFLVFPSALVLAIWEPVVTDL